MWVMVEHEYVVLRTWRAGPSSPPLGLQSGYSRSPRVVAFLLCSGFVTSEDFQFSSHE